MKNEIHPDNYRLVVFQDKSADFKFLTRSCAATKETIEWEDGNEYPLVNVEISSASHPFYTGKQKFVDAAGRLEKFGKKYNWEASSKDQIKEAARRRKKKAGKEKVGSLDIPTFKRKGGEEGEEPGGRRRKDDKPAPKAAAEETPAPKTAEQPAPDAVEKPAPEAAEQPAVGAAEPPAPEAAAAETAEQPAPEGAVAGTAGQPSPGAVEEPAAEDS